MIDSENQQPPSLAQKSSVSKAKDQPEDQVVSKKATIHSESTVSVAGSRWTSMAKKIAPIACVFVVAMLIAAFFACIPFLVYSDFAATACNDYKTQYPDSKPPCSVDNFFYNSNLSVGFVFVVISLILIVFRAIVGSLKFGSTKIGRLVGLGISFAVAGLTALSAILVTIGGLKSSEGQEWSKHFYHQDRDTGNITYYPAAFDMSIPIKATCWFAFLGVIPLIVCEFLIFRAKA